MASETAQRRKGEIGIKAEVSSDFSSDFVSMHFLILQVEIEFNLSFMMLKLLFFDQKVSNF